MGFLGGVTRALGRVGGFLHKVTDFVSKPLSIITKPLGNLADKFLDKLGPFGQFLKPVVHGFLDNAASFLMPGGLGIFSALAKAAPTLNKITSVVDTVNGALGGIDKLTKGGLPEVANNIMNIVANRQAQLPDLGLDLSSILGGK